MLKAFPRVAIGTALLLTGCQSSGWMLGMRKPAGAEAMSDASAGKGLIPFNKKGDTAAGVETFTKKGREQLQAYYKDSSRSSHLQEAEKSFERALLIDQKSAEAHHGLAVCLDLQKRYPVAEEHYKRAIAADPGNGTYVADLGYSYYLQNRYPESEKFLQQALSIDPSNSLATRNLGMTYAKQGKTELAESTFRRVMNDGEIRQAMAQVASQPSDITLASGEQKKPASASTAPPGSWDEVQARMEEARQSALRERDNRNRQQQIRQTGVDPRDYRGRDPYADVKQNLADLERSGSATARPNGPVYLDANGIQPVPHQATVYPESQQAYHPGGPIQQLGHLEVPANAQSWTPGANSPHAAPSQPTGYGAGYPAQSPAPQGGGGQQPQGRPPQPGPYYDGGNGYQQTTQFPPQGQPAVNAYGNRAPQGGQAAVAPAGGMNAYPGADGFGGGVPMTAQSIQQASAQGAAYAAAQGGANAPWGQDSPLVPNTLGPAMSAGPPMANSPQGAPPQGVNPYPANSPGAVPPGAGPASFGPPPFGATPPGPAAYNPAANPALFGPNPNGAAAMMMPPAGNMAPPAGPQSVGDLEQAKRQAAMMGLGVGPGPLFQSPSPPDAGAGAARNAPPNAGSMTWPAMPGAAMPGGAMPGAMMPGVDPRGQGFAAPPSAPLTMPASPPPAMNGAPDGLQAPQQLWNGAQTPPPGRILPTNVQIPDLRQAGHPDVESTWDLYRQQTNQLGQQTPGPSANYRTTNQFAAGSSFNGVNPAGAPPSGSAAPASLPPADALQSYDAERARAFRMEQQNQQLLSRTPSNAIPSPASQQRSLDPNMAAPADQMIQTWGNQSIVPPAYPSRTAEESSYRTKDFDRGGEAPSRYQPLENDYQAGTVIPERYPGSNPPPSNYSSSSTRSSGAASPGGYRSSALPAIVPAGGGR